MTLSFSEKQIKTVTELREKTAEVLREVETKGTPLLIVRRSRPAAILMSPSGATIVDKELREKEIEKELEFFRRLRAEGEQIDAVATVRKDRDSH